MSNEMFIPMAGPPRTETPSAEVYQKMGQDNIKQMVYDFYEELEKSSIRDLFPEDMEQSAEKSALFFIGFLGGPPLYQQTYGPPMLRQRHLPFQITENARMVWLSCFDTVLDGAAGKYGFPTEQLPVFRTFLRQFSAWMVNRSS